MTHDPVRWRKMVERLEDGEVELQELQDALDEMEKERDEAIKNYHFMIEKAADTEPTLDGYRELGQRAAKAKQRAEAAEAKVKEAEKHWEIDTKRFRGEVTVLQSRIDKAVDKALEYECGHIIIAILKGEADGKS